jgi:hypothetical protein
MIETILTIFVVLLLGFFNFVLWFKLDWYTAYIESYIKYKTIKYPGFEKIMRSKFQLWFARIIFLLGFTLVLGAIAGII